MLPFILTSFCGAVFSLPIGGFLSSTIYLVPSLLAVYCLIRPVRLLCRRSAHALPSQRADFAIATCCAGSCSMILFAFCLFSLQRQDAFTFLSLRSPLAGAFSFLLSGNLALPSIPHWFKFAVVCIPQTGILLLFGHDFGIFIPVGCVKSM